MKKLFTLAMVAFAALTSTLSFSSCSNEDPIDPTPTPSKTVSFYSDGQVKYNHVSDVVELASVLQTYFNENVGSLCTKVSVDTIQQSKDDVRIYVSIKASSKNEKALLAKFTEMQSNQTELNDKAGNIEGLIYFKLNIKSMSNGSTVFTYELESKYSVVGIWEGTNKAGETVTVEVPGTKDKDGDLLATVTIGSAKYDGVMDALGNNFLFNSYEMQKDTYGVNVNVVKAYLPLDGSDTSNGKLDVLGQDVESITFTRK